MTGILSALSGSSDMTTFVGGAVFSGLSGGGSAALRNYKATRSALALKPKTGAAAGSEASDYLHSEAFYAKKAVALKRQYKLMQNLYAISPDTIGPQITAMEKQIVELAAAYKKDVLSPKEDKALADKQKAATSTKGTVVNTTA